MHPKTRAKTTSYCKRCLFTIRKGELVNVDVAPLGYSHINCRAAILDGTGRTIHPDFKHFLDHMDPEEVGKVLGSKENKLEN